MGDGSDLMGKDILSQDASQVQIPPLRPFYMGEIVAWRFQNGEKLKYGRVPENVRPSSGQALYRLGVETSSGIIESLLSTQVFSFKSVSLEFELTSDMSSDSGQIIPETTYIPGGTKSGNSASTQAGKELQYGRVAPAELVQSFHQMLSAAGVNVDMEAQTLLSTNLTLREQLQDSQDALLLEQDKAESAAKEADTAKAAWQCRICLAAEVDLAMIPCGHILCRRCSSVVSRYPFCRLLVSQTMKIFRP